MLTLMAGVSGGELSYTWMKNGAPLSNSDRLSGANSPAVRITGVVPGDAGAYSLLVANGRGSRVSASAMVEVSNQPAGGFDAIFIKLVNS